MAGLGPVEQFGITLDGTNSYDGGQSTGYEKYIRGGFLMGRITSSGLWRPCPRTKTNGAGSATATLVVDNSIPFQAGDVIVIGATSGTISSIVYSTHTITLSATKTWGDNEPVYVDDGSQLCRGILLDSEVNCWDINKVNKINPGAELMIRGRAQSSYILGDLAAVLEDRQNLIAGRILIDNYDVIGSSSWPLPRNIEWRQMSIAADKTLVAGDSGGEFFATAAVNLTLPAIASAGQGFRVRIHQTADANLTVTAPSGKLIALNNAAATSVAASTSSQKIGAGFEICFLPDLSKYKVVMLNAGVQAVTVA
jgi:hypothetical protein